MDEIDYQSFIEDHFTIIDKNDRRVPFLLNPVQVKALNAMTGRDNILKARQEGMSSLILAMFTVDFLLCENTRSVCIAHDKDSTIKLFTRVKYFIRSFEELTGEKVPLGYNTRTEIVNEANNSVFYIGTAGSSSFGRSATLTNVHFSEFAFYPNPEEVFTAASQAGTPKRIIIETTANGMGTFYYKLWHDSQAVRNTYKPHFFSWADFPEYSAPSNVNIELTSEEQKLREQFNLTVQQLAWRRMKMTEFVNEYMFKQEYPLYAEEAFISSGNPVFSTETLQWYKTKPEMIFLPIKIGNLVGVKPPFLESNEKGYLKVWREPVKGRQYIIGADACEGTKHGDYACAQVIDRLNMEQVAVWHGRVEPDMFGRELWKLGMWYNTAFIAPERNSVGIAAVIALRDLFYPNIYSRERVDKLTDESTKDIGWQTDSRSKPLMISSTAKALREKSVHIHDEATLLELFSYQYDDSGHASAPTGAHDDRVVAFMIAVEMYNRIPLDLGKNDLLAPPVSETNDSFYTESSMFG